MADKKLKENCQQNLQSVLFKKNKKQENQTWTE